MTSDLISRLSAVKEAADGENTDRDNYQAYVADRMENGGWSHADVAEYKDKVRRIMAEGTDEEKTAAREFWAHKAIRPTPEAGINERIHRQMQEAA